MIKRDKCHESGRCVSPFSNQLCNLVELYKIDFIKFALFRDLQYSWILTYNEWVVPIVLRGKRVQFGGFAIRAPPTVAQKGDIFPIHHGKSRYGEPARNTNYTVTNVTDCIWLTCSIGLHANAH